MINKDQIIPLLITVTPSFQSEWDNHRIKYGEDLVYVALGDYAEKLLQLQQAKHQDELHSIAKVIEHILAEGTSEAREIITIGLLETLQNICANREIDPELFVEFLLPESLEQWNCLNDFWGKKIQLDNDMLL